jgi:tetratricopeptide (TPR) repeat protein
MLARVAVVFFLWMGVAEARVKRVRKSAPVPVAKAPAAPAPETIEGAMQLYQNAQFAESLAILDKVVRQTTDPLALKQAKLYLAMNFLALGNDARAKSAFQELLDLDPDFELPTFSSPSVRQFYARVKADYKIIPVITHTPPVDVDAVKGAAFDITVKRMRPGYEAQLFYHTPGAASFSRVDLSRVQGDAYVARLPTALLLHDQGYSLEYYIAVSEGPAHVLAQLRSAASPYVVPVAVPVQLRVGPPVYKKWWFWTAVGGAAVVAAAVVTTVVITSQTPPTGEAHVALKF